MNPDEKTSDPFDNQYKPYKPYLDNDPFERAKQVAAEAQTRFEELKATVLDYKTELIAAGVLTALVVFSVRKRGKSKAAAKALEDVVTISVSGDQIEMLKNADNLTVLYDTPLGQLLLAAVPQR